MSEHDHTHRELFDEMLSLSANLGHPAPPPAAPPEPHIPVLFDVVDIPAGPALAAPARWPPEAQPQSWPDPADIDTRAALEIESGFIVDALMDEFLPLLEARLRERLEQKQLELLASASAHAAPPPKER